jgi:phage shock protein C
MKNRLYRDEYNKKIGGVCAGLAEYFNVDVSLVRGIFLIALIAKGCGLIYFILWAVVPKKPFVAPEGDYYTTPQPQPFIPAKTSPSSATIIGGIILIMVGAFLLLDEFNIIPGFDFTTFWPVILIVIGLVLMLGYWQNKPAAGQPTTFKNDITNDSTTDGTPSI